MTVDKNQSASGQIETSCLATRKNYIAKRLHFFSMPASHRHRKRRKFSALSAPRAKRAVNISYQTNEVAIESPIQLVA
jgi:hypothetical protein